MSNLLYMDESNGNGVYASKTVNNTNNTNTTTNTAATTAATTTSTNNINNIMNSAVRSASSNATTAEILSTSVSNEDLSQSLSEYTDADESISAPTEFLAEFLSAVMLKDYKKALKYCKLILQYEPNNATAKEFYPLILDKLRGATSSDSDENYNKSSSPDMVIELQSSDPSAGGSEDAGSDDVGQLAGAVDDGADEFCVPEDNSSGEPNSNNTSSSCSAGVSLSESVDEDDEDDDVDDDEDEDEDEDGEEEDVISSSGDDLPIDDQQESGSAEDGSGDGVEAVGNNGSNSSRNSSSGGGGRSRSDNTTHSYSSLLLEEEDDIVPVNLHFTKELPSPDLDVSNGNKMPSTSCSDSESPTEPLTQRLAAILRSKCGVSSTGNNY